MMGSVVKKDSKNDYYKSKYASLGAHLDLCEEPLDLHGLILLTTINGTPEKPILIATLMDMESAQWIKSYIPLPNPKMDSQGLGSAITYMRRYAMNSLFGLTAEDDDGESNSVRAEAKKPEDSITKEQAKELIDLFSKMKPESRKALKCGIENRFKSPNFAKIPKESFDKIKKHMLEEIETQEEVINEQVG
jgi:hypothetical protein